MISSVKIYTTNRKELDKFLKQFDPALYKLSNYNQTEQTLYWEKKYDNPIELADLIAAYIDNKENFPNSNMWISIDPRNFHKYKI